MKMKYKINVKTTEEGYLLVTADSEDEAETKVNDLVDIGYELAGFMGDEDISAYVHTEGPVARIQCVEDWTS